jgi:predicted nucleotidyltransferase
MAHKLNRRKVRLHCLETRRIPRRKGRFPPKKPSSRKKSKASMTKMKTTLTSDDFDFIVVALNDASLEITEKKEAQQEEIYNRIKVELQGVQQALQSSRAVSTRLYHWKHQNWEMS